VENLIHHKNRQVNPLPLMLPPAHVDPVLAELRKEAKTLDIVASGRINHAVSGIRG